MGFAAGCGISSFAQHCSQAIRLSPLTAMCSVCTHALQAVTLSHETRPSSGGCYGWAICSFHFLRAWNGTNLMVSGSMSSKVLNEQYIVPDNPKVLKEQYIVP
eukprot:1069274-Amphidinium_carterae.1